MTKTCLFVVWHRKCKNEKLNCHTLNEPNTLSKMSLSMYLYYVNVYCNSMVCILYLMHWVLYLKTHIGARNNVGNITLRFNIKVHIKINLMDPILLLFWMILCKLQSPAPSWWKQEQSTKVSVLEMISKANFMVALASSVFMQMEDAMEGRNPQWGSTNNIKNILWSNKREPKQWMKGNKYIKHRYIQGKIIERWWIFNKYLNV